MLKHAHTHTQLPPPPSLYPSLCLTCTHTLSPYPPSLPLPALSLTLTLALLTTVKQLKHSGSTFMCGGGGGGGVGGGGVGGEGDCRDVLACMVIMAYHGSIQNQNVMKEPLSNPRLGSFLSSYVNDVRFLLLRWAVNCKWETASELLIRDW